jgi:hypothetical protein
MASLYLFSVLVGGVLLAVGAFGGGHDHHGATGVDHSHDSEGAGKLLSIRTLTYFLFVFGGVGAALTWGWRDAYSIVVLALALLSGLGVAGLVAYAFRYLAQTDSGSRDGEDSFVGLQGRVVLPIGAAGLGKICVERGGRSYELIARPHKSASTSAGWKAVVVVEMQRGTALVAPLDDPVLLEGS